MFETLTYGVAIYCSIPSYYAKLKLPHNYQPLFINQTNIKNNRRIVQRIFMELKFLKSSDVISSGITKLLYLFKFLSGRIWPVR